MVKKKIKLFAIVCLYMNICVAQMSYDEYRVVLNSHEVFDQTLSLYEIKDLAEVLSIQTAYFLIDTINQDTSAVSNRIEYFDGEGNVEFLSGNNFEMEETRVWLKQYDKPFQYFNIYTDHLKEAHFSNEMSNDSTSILAFHHPELMVNTSIVLDVLGMKTTSDSTYREFTFDRDRNFTKVNMIYKKMETPILWQYEILNTDERNNWTERIVKIKSIDYAAEFHEIREIKYTDDYEVSKYFEVKVDALSIDGQLISDPEIFNPELNETKLKSIKEGEYFEQKDLYKSISSLFHKKYFNDDYFIKFSVTDEDAAEQLKERLFEYLRTHVIDIKNEKFYIGRTRSDRWFDHTAGFKSIEGMEDPPIPTENWLKINGYKCREYVKKSVSGKDEKFYVTEGLPFINYCDFTFTLPGFVIQSTRHIPSIGEVELTVNVNPCKYPFHLFELLNKLNEKYGTEIEYLQQKEN